MVSLYLVRLGETENNINGIWSGRNADSPLTAKGKKQSVTIADILAGKEITAIYSSPSGRVIDSAKYLADRINQVIIPASEFQEIDLGDFDGKLSKEVSTTTIGKIFISDPTNVKFPGAVVSLEDSQEIAIDRIKSILTETPADGNVAIYTHGATMRLIILGLLGIGSGLSTFWRFRIGNSAVAHLIYKNEQYELQELLNFGGLSLND